MIRLGNFLIAALAIVFLLGVEARAQSINVDASISGSSGSVQGTGTAGTGYGHLTYFAMQITGPDGGGQAYNANLSNQNQNFLSHSVSSTYLPDTDYDLEVCACASDDDGEYCDVAHAHYHTPSTGSGMEPGAPCANNFGSPYPYVTSVEPSTFHTYYPGTYTYTVNGGNLEGVILGVSWIWSFNGTQTGGPGAGAYNIISSSPNQVIFQENYTGYGDWEVAWYLGAKLWVQDPQNLTPCYFPMEVAP